MTSLGTNVVLEGSLPSSRATWEEEKGEEVDGERTERSCGEGRKRKERWKAFQFISFWHFQHLLLDSAQ